MANLKEMDYRINFEVDGVSYECRTSADSEKHAYEIAKHHFNSWCKNLRVSFIFMEDDYIATVENLLEILKEKHGL